MTDGLQDIAAVGADIEIGERRYRLAPISLGALGEIEQQVVALRTDPIAAICGCIDRFTVPQQQYLLSEAVRQASKRGRYATQAEVDAFLNTFDGIGFFFWLTVRKHHPEIDAPEKARLLIADLDPTAIAQLQRKLIEASGLTALAAIGKNSFSPAHPIRCGARPGPASTSS
jgi:hypothetical protein